MTRGDAVPVKKREEPKKFEAWSWSRFNDHRRCAFYAKLKYLDKLQEPTGPAMERGSQIHRLAEKHVRDGGALPSELARFAKEFARLRKASADVEGQLAVDRGWRPAEWFGRDAWLRVVTDARYTERRGKTLVMVDHKTGKVYPDNEEQMSLYSPALFAHHPAAEELVVKLWYLDFGVEKTFRYAREGIARPAEGEMAPSFEALKRDWTEKAYPIMTDRKFVATPNDKCRYCHFRKANGGPCKY